MHTSYTNCSSTDRTCNANTGEMKDKLVKLFFIKYLWFNYLKYNLCGSHRKMNCKNVKQHIEKRTDTTK